MEALIYFLIWGALLFVMIRFGCGAHLMGRHTQSREAGPDNDNSQTLRWVAPKRGADPVCGKAVVTADAKSSVFDGNVYYFCSRDCREIFEAAPRSYLDGSGAPTRELLEKSHV